MHIKFGNRWVEYRDPINLMDNPSNASIGLRCYHKGTNNKWTFDPNDHWMVDLKKNITLASMTYDKIESL